MPKQPQDHKRPESDEATAYTFKVSNKTYRLPVANEEAVGNIPGRFMRDVAMGSDEQAEVRLGFALLESMDLKPGTLDALYDLPTLKMMEHLKSWMVLSDKNGVSLGESSASSD